MGGKAKTQKHSAKELKAKEFASTVNRGGGAAGKEDRMGGKAGHARYKCANCGQQAPSVKNMKEHWEAKHSKLPYVESDCVIDVHSMHGGTTQGVAIRGATGKKA